LGGHELGEVEELLVFLLGPFGLFDGRVEPFIPALPTTSVIKLMPERSSDSHGLALLGCLADQKRADSGPLVLAVLRDGSLEDLILGAGDA
jgi:hypothetical protein